MKIEFEKIDPRKTIVLVIDVQNNFCSPQGFGAKTWNQDVSSSEKIIEKIRRFVSEVQKYGIEVLYTQLFYDAEKMSKSLKKKLGPFAGKYVAPDSVGSEFYKINPPKNKVFVKYGFDALRNEELLRYLKEIEIENIIFTGFTSCICVESTARNAVDLGFNAIIVEDLVGEPKFLEEHRKASLFTFNLIMGDVVKSEAILEVWENSKEALEKIKELESELKKLYEKLK